MLSGMNTHIGTGPGARRRYLGKLLRGLRGGRSLADAAREIGVSPSALSRIEGGRNAIMPRHVSALIRVYGVEEARAASLLRIAEAAQQPGWWESYSDVISDWFEIYASLEADARAIWIYEAEFVPGLMQTDDYVRAVRRSAHPEATPEQIERSVALRAERQRNVRADITAVVNEAVVRRMVGGPEVMRAQVRRLREEADAGRLRVVPFSAGAHPGMHGAFWMLRFDDDANGMDLVYVETERGGMYLERPSDLKRYTEVFTRLVSQSLSAEETSDLLVTLVEE